MTTIDTALNLTWALLCVSALAYQWWRERNLQSHDTRAARTRRALSVFVAVVALFPCISASDDRVCLLDVDGLVNSHVAIGAAHTANPLAMQLEDLEHGQTAVPFVLILVLCFLLMVRLEQTGFTLSTSRDSQSRAPPLPA